MSFLRRQESRMNGIRMDDTNSILENPNFSNNVGSHREWLKQFHEGHLKKWDDLFTRINRSDIFDLDGILADTRDGWFPLFAEPGSII
jgi:hypothetical protein